MQCTVQTFGSILPWAPLVNKAHMHVITLVDLRDWDYRRKFWKEPQNIKYQNLVLWVWFERYFLSSKAYQADEDSPNSMVILDLNSLFSGTNPRILTPQIYDDRTRHFYITHLFESSDFTGYYKVWYHQYLQRQLPRCSWTWWKLQGRTAHHRCSEHRLG